MMNKKKLLVNAYVRAIEALLSLPNSEKEIEKYLEELKAFVSAEEVRFATLDIKYLVKQQKYGEALQRLAKCSEDATKKGDPKEKELFELQLQIVKKLGWTEWEAYLKKWLLLRYPDDFSLF